MTLSETWFIEGYIDFELQKYRLLAYLTEVKQQFDEVRLYPRLSEIVNNYNNLVAFQHSKHMLQDQFPRRMAQVDMQRLEIIYERMLADNELMAELEQITQYALGEMKGTIAAGTELYELIEKQLHIEPVGILPLYKNEGYLMLRVSNTAEVRIYTYNMTIFEHKDARYRGLKMEYVESYSKMPANTYEQIKLQLIRAIRTLPNPAVYKVESEMAVPFAETLLPVTKRMLVRHIGIA